MSQSLEITEQDKARWQSLINNEFAVYQEIYGSKEEMLRFGLKFQQIYRDYKIAFNEFYSINQFYLILKNIFKNKKLHNDFLDFSAPNQQSEDIHALMMTISLIEKLTSQEDYLTFPEWLKKGESSQDPKEKIGRANTFCYSQFRKACSEKFREYNETFGCSHRFRNFFVEQKFITKKEQMQLLKSISYYPQDGKQTSHVPMFCYSDNECGGKDCFNKKNEIMCRGNDCFNESTCVRRELGCLYIKEENCPAYLSDQKLEKAIKEFANFLYTLRNRYVHNAHIFSLSSNDERCFHTPALLDYIVNYRFRDDKKKPFTGCIVIRLDPQDLINIVNRNFKELLNQYTDIRLDKLLGAMPSTE
jgi:hypothetical protein